MTPSKLQYKLMSLFQNEEGVVQTASSPNEGIRDNRG